MPKLNIAVLAFGLQFVFSLALYAGEGAGTPTVSYGGADISRSGNDLTVDTHGRNTIIQWDHFNVPGGSHTRFNQPDAASATLNRVYGDMPSRVDGLLSSNGQVYLVNPRGVTVGPDGVIRADGGFVASSYDISNQDFLRGDTVDQYYRSAPGGSGNVVNQGYIQSANGDVFLIGTQVTNSGTVSGPYGTVGFAAAGDGAVVIHPVGGAEGRISVIAGASSFNGTGVHNAGLVEAAAAELRSHGDAYRMAVNNTGVIEARGVSTDDSGRVFLTGIGADGGAAGEVVNYGTVRALSHDGSGGSASITGEKVTLASGSVVDVSAEYGSGGVARIGGEYQGGKNLSVAELENAIPSASNVTVEDGAQVLANAAGTGDGGNVVIWADQRTEFSGTVTALGGLYGGNGGFAEVSGKDRLYFNGFVDLRAQAEGGRNGLLLLDPTDFVIRSGYSGTVNSGIDNTFLESLLSGSHVVIMTDSQGAEAGDITISADVIWDSGNSLMLLAHGSIVLDGGRVASRHVSQGDVIAVAGWDGSAFIGTFFPGYNGVSDINDFPRPIKPTDRGELAAAGWFGNNNGSIIVSPGLGVGSHAVLGSLGGDTEVYGYDVVLQGGANSGQSVMIGAGLSVGGEVATGTIGVYAKNDVRLTGGSGVGNSTSADIGHRIGNGSANTADINVIAGGDISLTGGSGSISYASIGHALSTADVPTATNSSIRVMADNIFMNAGLGKQSYVLIGHGGYSTTTNPFNTSLSGIEVTAAGNLTMTAGSGQTSQVGSFAQIGHGGLAEDSILNASGAAIKVAVNGEIRMSLAADADSTHVKIGHGGVMKEINATNATVDVSAGESLVMILMGAESGSPHGIAQIGHGGFWSSGMDSYYQLEAGRAHLIVNAKSATLTANGGELSSLIIGHGGNSSTTNEVFQDYSAGPADWRMVLDGDLSLTGNGSGLKTSILQLGHGVFNEVLGNVYAPTNNSGNMLLDLASGKLSVSNVSQALPRRLVIGHAGDGDFNLLVNEASAANVLDMRYFSLANKGDIVFASRGDLYLGGIPSSGFFGNIHLLSNWSGTHVKGSMVSPWDPGTTVNKTGAGVLSVNTQIQSIESKNITLRGAAMNIDGTIAAGGRLGIDAGGTVTIGSNGRLVSTASTQNALLLIAGKLVNNNAATASGSIALETTGIGSRWLVSLTGDDATSSTLGGINGTWREYNKTATISSAGFAVPVDLPSGNGLMVSGDAPIITFTTAGLAALIYGDALPSFDWVYNFSGLAFDDNASTVLADLNIIRAIGAYQPGNVLNAGTYSQTATGTSANALSLGYTLAFTPKDLTVSPRAITVAPDSFSRQYGDANPTFTWNVIAGTLLGGHTVSGGLTTGAGQYSDVGLYDIIGTNPTIGGTNANNYSVSVSPTPGILTVTARPLTVTVDDFSRVYGEANPVFTWSANNLVNNDQPTGSLSSVAGITTGIGDYAITSSLDFGPNYQLQAPIANGNLRITTRPITVTADNQIKLYLEENPNLTFTITGGLVGNDTSSGSLYTEATDSSAVGYYAITQGSLDFGRNYSVRFNPGILAITDGTSNENNDNSFIYDEKPLPPDFSDIDWESLFPDTKVDVGGILGEEGNLGLPSQDAASSGEQTSLAETKFLADVFVGSGLDSAGEVGSFFADMVDLRGNTDPDSVDIAFAAAKTFEWLYATERMFQALDDVIASLPRELADVLREYRDATMTIIRPQAVLAMKHLRSISSSLKGLEATPESERDGMALAAVSGRASAVYRISDVIWLALARLDAAAGIMRTASRNHAPMTMNDLLEGVAQKDGELMAMVALADARRDGVFLENTRKHLQDGATMSWDGAAPQDSGALDIR